MVDQARHWTQAEPIRPSLPGTWSVSNERLNVSNSSRVRATASQSHMQTSVTEERKQESRGRKQYYRKKEVRRYTACEKITDRKTQKYAEDRRDRDKGAETERREQKKREKDGSTHRKRNYLTMSLLCSLCSRFVAPRCGHEMEERGWQNPRPDWQALPLASAPSPSLLRISPVAGYSLHTVEIQCLVLKEWVKVAPHGSPCKAPSERPAGRVQKSLVTWVASG